jgi:hypothetical protein
MANIRDILMGVLFFGDGYVKAKKRNDEAQADKNYRAMKMKEAELAVEMARSKQKIMEQQEKRLAKERERKAKAEQAALATAGGANPINVLAGLMQETPVSRVTGEPKTSEAQLPKIDLQLRGQPSQDTSTNTEAIDQLRRGEGRLPHQRRRIDALPTRPDLVQQQAGRGMEQRPARGYPLPRVEMPGVDVVGQPMEPRFPRPSVRTPRPSERFRSTSLERESAFEAEPILTPDQQKIKKRNEASWGLNVPGNTDKAVVPIPAKNIGPKVPEAAVNKTAQIFNSTISEAEKKASDVLQVLLPMWNPDLKNIVIPGSQKDLAIQADAYSKNIETRFVEGPDGSMTFVTADKSDGSMITSTQVIPGKDKQPLTYTDWKVFTEDNLDLKKKLLIGEMTYGEAAKIAASAEDRLTMGGLTPLGTQPVIDPVNETMTFYYIRNDDPLGPPVTITRPAPPKILSPDEIMRISTNTGKWLSPDTDLGDLVKKGIVLQPETLDEDRPLKPEQIQYWATALNMELPPGITTNGLVELAKESGREISPDVIKPKLYDIWFGPDGKGWELWADPSASELIKKPFTIDGQRQTKTSASPNESSNPGTRFNQFQIDYRLLLNDYRTAEEYYGVVKSSFNDIVNILNETPETGEILENWKVDGLVTLEDKTKKLESGQEVSYKQLVMTAKLRERLRANPETINVATQALIFGFNKLLDPPSTVRAEEYARMGIGESIRNRLEGAWIGMTRGGGGLGLDTIQAIMNTSNSIWDGKIRLYRKRTAKSVNTAIVYSDPKSPLYLGPGYNINQLLGPSVGEMWTSKEKPLSMSSNLQDWKDAVNHWLGVHKPDPVTGRSGFQNLAGQEKPGSLGDND